MRQLPLSLVRTWVRGEVEMLFVGGNRNVYVGSSRVDEVVGRERRENLGWKKNRGEADFFRFLDPIFSSLRPSNPPLFIDGEKE